MIFQPIKNFPYGFYFYARDGGYDLIRLVAETTVFGDGSSLMVIRDLEIETDLFPTNINREETPPKLLIRAARFACNEFHTPLGIMVNDPIFKGLNGRLWKRHFNTLERDGRAFKVMKTVRSPGGTVRQDIEHWMIPCEATALRGIGDGDWLQGYLSRWR